jgi:predicted alpha/beta hydrolase family esterase
MNYIAGIPYVVAEFDGSGALQNEVTLPDGVTDVIVMSHGWNNDRADAEHLYEQLFTSFAPLASDLQNRKLAIVGVIWPSKRFDELVAATASSNGAQGSASLSAPAGSASDALLAEKLEGMKAFFDSAEQKALIDELHALIPDLEDNGSARKEFVEKARKLLDPGAADREDMSTVFFKDDGNEIMKRLKIDEEDLDTSVTDGAEGSASLPLGVGVVKPATGGAAGFFGFLSGFKAAAMNVMNFTTYYEMKSRAGKVGRNGVGPLVDKLAQQVERVHLVGHSFGGRVVTAAAAGSTTDRIRSMSLLQTAFSHSGFSKEKKGFFRSVVDSRRVNGPIIVTHSVKDKAVGVAYPIASRLNGDTAAALGDANDKFGGLGRNGAQHMESGEAVEGKLLPVGGAYQFEAGKFYNLEANDLIPGHSDITGREVAQAIRSAMA